MGEVSMRQRLPRDLTWMAGGVILWGTFLFVRQWGVGLDSRAYAAAWDGGMYDAPPATQDAYLYSPTFAQVIWPLTRLPESVFVAVVAVVSLGTLTWLVWPLGWRWAAPVLLCCSFEVATGNINWLFALVVAFGLRQPVWWVVPLLTKVTPCLGPVWFLVRREWGMLFRCLAAITTVVLVSSMIAPDLWREWIAFLLDNGDAASGVLGGSLMPPPAIRVPLAVVVVAIGAWRDRPSALPIGMILAAPVFGIGSVAILAGLARLSRPVGDPRSPAD